MDDRCIFIHGSQHEPEVQTLIDLTLSQMYIDYTLFAKVSALCWYHHGVLTRTKSKYPDADSAIREADLNMIWRHPSIWKTMSSF